MKPFTGGLDRVASNVPTGMVWQYRIVMKGDYPSPEHIWILSDERGAIHVHCTWSSFGGGSEWLGGIECHFATPPDYMSDTPPHHERCWVLGKPCWHDGTSLGFSEQIAPYLPTHTHAMDESDHASVLSVMKHWHRSHFPASVDRSGEAGQTPLGGSTEGESAARSEAKGDAQ